jgi:hypothetical protein
MKTFLHWVLAFIMVTAFWMVVLALIPAPDSGRYYDCSMAEFHPDFPPEVKEQCRRIRQERWIEQHHSTT